MIFSGVVDTFCKNGNFCNYESLKSDDQCNKSTNTVEPV
jgi:hypothetical protein